jgi:hypothetical protein
MQNNAIFYDDGPPVKLRKWNAVDTANSVSIPLQAAFYVKWIKENDKTDLWFFPLKKTESAHANQFRHHVLNLAAGHGADYLPYGHTVKSWRHLLQQNIIAAGRYSINQYIPE